MKEPIQRVSKELTQKAKPKKQAEPNYSAGEACLSCKTTSRKAKIKDIKEKGNLTQCTILDWILDFLKSGMQDIRGTVGKLLSLRLPIR